MDGKQKYNKDEILEGEVKILKSLSAEFPGIIKEVFVKGKKVFPETGEDKIRNLIDFVE